ncbi:hypothetical protein [Acaryochloris marina]|uniref:hypothetical protein n=1 Tax=Acaryochloris marina TaxID=155978 RepID=UPI001BB00950|nr:hypothetical protein [Acaryochloris marina]QUY46153.1 hypothetical protein I1H34_30980 [Acaryochloris marina S15]
MSKELGLIAIHGMGDTPIDFSDELEQILSQQVGGELWKKIHFESVYYQGILQNNERRVWNNMQLLSTEKLRWSLLRKFMLFGLADASSLEHKADADNSVYKQTQKIIAESLRKTKSQLIDKDRPVIVIAQSLGGQVISNYIWDSQTGGNGIWKNGTPDSLNPSADEKEFLQLKTMRSLYTTGCNIPLFVAGFDKISAFNGAVMHPQFQWKNYYDRDDVLGWPLQPLSNDYDKLVKDIEINAGNIVSAFTPFSHNEYWSDPDFTKPLSQEIVGILNNP